MIIINNIFMIGILYSILIFFDKTSEKKELNKNNRIKTVVAIFKKRYILFLLYIVEYFIINNIFSFNIYDAYINVWFLKFFGV